MCVSWCSSGAVVKTHTVRSVYRPVYQQHAAYCTGKKNAQKQFKEIKKTCFCGKIYISIKCIPPNVQNILKLNLDCHVGKINRHKLYLNS